MDSINISDSNITLNKTLVTETLSFRVPYASLLLVIFLFSVSSGSFVCYVIKTTNMMRKRIWFYFFMLSFVDAATSFFAIPLIFAATIDEKILQNRWICTLNKTIFMFFGCWTLLTVATLSLYKCIIISSNKHFRPCNTDVICYFIISLSISLFFALAPIFGFSKFTYMRGRKICVLRSDNQNNDLLFSALCGITVYFIPVCVIIGSSVMIFRRVRQQNKVRQKRLNDSKKSNITVLKTLLLLVVNFFVFWTPILCVLLLGTAKVKMHPLVGHVAWLLMFVQSCIDPVIYCVRHTTFQNAFKSIIHKRKASRQVEKRPCPNTVLSVTRSDWKGDCI